LEWLGSHYKPFLKWHVNKIGIVASHVGVSIQMTTRQSVYQLYPPSGLYQLYPPSGLNQLYPPSGLYQLYQAHLTVIWVETLTCGCRYVTMTAHTWWESRGTLTIIKI